MTASITLFKKDNHYLSNFYIASFVYEGILWPHSEAAYQAYKTLDRDLRISFVNMTPGGAKRAGRINKTLLRADWENVKQEVMYNIVRAKFQQNPTIMQQLLDTGDAYLEEGNFHGDNIWGCSPPNNPNGKNWLGHILMELRDEWLNTESNSHNN